MSRSLAAVFTARFVAFAGAAAVAVAVPLLGASTVTSADGKQGPPSSSSATTNGDDWIG